MTFQGVDYYDVDGMLEPEERAVRDMVRGWVEEEVMPIIQRHYVDKTFPTELISPMAELGFLGANLPEKYGCAGLNNVAYGIIMQELERGDSGLRSFASVQGALVMYPIHAFGSEEQRQTWLPALASGEKIGCFGLTEPDFGSNPGGMLTRAVKDGDEWVLNGAKMWITNGSMADVAVVWAKTGEVDDAGSIRGFIVETDRDGFSAKDQKGKLSLLASDTSELVLQDVRVPDANLLPGSGGLKSPLMCLTQARYGIAWGAVGAAMACYDEAVSYAGNRVQFGGKPIAATQIQQVRLAEMLTEITKAQLLVLRLGRLKDAGTMRPQQVSMAKRNNVNMACECAREARRLLGANGILVEYQAMRHMANLESVYTYEGTHDVHGLILGQDITGAGDHPGVRGGLLSVCHPADFGGGSAGAGPRRRLGRRSRAAPGSGRRGAHPDRGRRAPHVGDGLSGKLHGVCAHGALRIPGGGWPVPVRAQPALPGDAAAGPGARGRGQSTGLGGARRRAVVRGAAPRRSRGGSPARASRGGLPSLRARRVALPPLAPPARSRLRRPAELARRVAGRGRPVVPGGRHGGRRLDPVDRPFGATRRPRSRAPVGRLTALDRPLRRRGEAGVRTAQARAVCPTCRRRPGRIAAG